MNNKYVFYSSYDYIHIPFLGAYWPFARNMISRIIKCTISPEETDWGHWLFAASCDWGVIRTSSAERSIMGISAIDNDGRTWRVHALPQAGAR